MITASGVFSACPGFRPGAGALEAGWRLPSAQIVSWRARDVRWEIALHTHRRRLAVWPAPRAQPLPAAEAEGTCSSVVAINAATAALNTAIATFLSGALGADLLGARRETHAEAPSSLKSTVSLHDAQALLVGPLA